MTLSRNAQNVLNIIILVIIGALLFWLRPPLANKVHGIALPTQTLPSPIVPAKSVKLYNVAPSGDYKVMGRLRSVQNVEAKKGVNAVNWLNYRNAGLAKFEELAKAMGANGVVINRYFASMEGPVNTFDLFGIAIKTNPS